MNIFTELPEFYYKQAPRCFHVALSYGRSQLLILGLRGMGLKILQACLNGHAIYERWRAVFEMKRSSSFDAMYVYIIYDHIFI